MNRRFLVLFNLIILANSVICAQEPGRGPEYINDATARPVKGKTYAVIVGINKYQSRKILPLNFAVADAKAFKEFLLSKAGGQIPEENIRTFFNDSATSNQIKKLGLHWINTVAKAGDRVFLYFSGHGLTVSGGDSYFLANDLASDFFVEDIEEAGTQPLHQLKTNTIGPLTDKGVEVVLIVDACRSHLADSLRSRTVLSFNPDMNTEEMNKGDMMFLSSSNGQSSGETDRDGINHGIFTYFLLRGLYGLDINNNTGVITFSKLKNYITEQVSDFTKETQIPIIEYKPKADRNRNPIIAIVDKDLQTKERLVFKTISNEPLLAVNRAYSSSEYFAFDTSSLYGRLVASLKKGILWGSYGCLNYFNQLEKSHNDNAQLKEIALSVSALLADSGQAIINAYLGAKEMFFNEHYKYNKSIDPLTPAFVIGTLIYDTLYKISKKYFPLDKENIDYLQHYYFFKGYSLAKSRSIKDQSVALKFLLKAYDLDTNKTFILKDIAVVYDAQRKYDLAITTLQRVLTKYPDWLFAWQLLGIVYNDAEKYEDAIAAYKRAIEISPAYVYGWNGLGLVYYDLKRYSLSLQNFNHALQIDSSQVFALVNIGNYYFNVLKNYEAAEKYYRKVIDLDTSYALAWNNLGLVLKAQNHNEEAIECFQRAITIDSNFVDGWFNLGLLYETSDPVYAEKLYEKVTEIDLNYANAYYSLSNLYFERKNYKKAKLFVKKSISMGPGNPNPWNTLGGVYTSLKQYDSAVYCFRTAIRLNDKQWITAANLATVFKYEKRPDSALKYYWAALTKPESDSNLLLTRLEEVYELKCDFYSQKDFYRFLIKIDSSNTLAWKKLAKTYQKLNDLSNAENCYWQTYSLGLSGDDLYSIAKLKLKNGSNLKSDEDTFFALAMYYYRIGDYEKTSKVLNFVVTNFHKKIDHRKFSKIPDELWQRIEELNFKGRE